MRERVLQVLVMPVMLVYTMFYVIAFCGLWLTEVFQLVISATGTWRSSTSVIDEASGPSR
jgi:hypothetical protein